MSAEKHREAFFGPTFTASAGRNTDTHPNPVWADADAKADP